MSQAEESTAPQAQAPGWPAPRVAWTTTILLAIGYVFSYVDRQVISILAPLVKADLRLTDVELSLLLGPSFAIPFAAFGLLMGWLADRTVRTRMIVAAMSFWSIMTALCGMTSSFTALFLCRVGVGVGEAAMNPAAVSIISDQFHPVMRPRALSLYNLGTTVGIVAAYLLIGSLIPTHDVTVPLLGSLRSWQFVFVLLGLPGILYALVLLSMREPVRRNLMRGTAAAATYGDTLRFMWQRRAAFIPFFVGMALLALLVYGPASQTVLFMTRTFHWSIQKTAQWNGVVLLVSGVPGAIFGGWLASRLRAAGKPDGTLRAMLLAATGLVLPICLAYQMPTPALFWLFSGLQNFCVASSINLGSAAIADITPNQLRGKAVAIMGVILTMVGLGAGPSLIALITQHVVGDEQAIRHSISIFAAAGAPLTVVALAVARPAFRRVAAEAASWTGVEHKPS